MSESFVSQQNRWHKATVTKKIVTISLDHCIKKYSGLPNERTGTDQNAWAKMLASTLIKHITENPSKIWRPVRSGNMKKSIKTIFVAILEIKKNAFMVAAFSHFFGQRQYNYRQILFIYFLRSPQA